MYAAGVVSQLSRVLPSARFYGCAGPKLQQLGVEPVVDAASLSVVGLAEVIAHIPRIYGEFRNLVRHAERCRPDAALLVDSPDFHLRLARRLKSLRVPIYYLVAPQVWAWRQGRVKAVRDLVDKLFCLFPFEETWFRERGVNASYIGHPLAATVRRSCSREAFFASHGLPTDRKTIVLLPGSRPGEVTRHLPVLFDAVKELRSRFPLSVLLATPQGFPSRAALRKFREPIEALSIQVVENETWDSIGHADLALAASGTVTIEAAILGTPMVTFYRVMPLTWHAGRRLVKAPFLSMVNLVADRQIVPELMQHQMTARNLFDAAAELLANDRLADRMRLDLASVRAALTKEGNPFERVSGSILADLSPSATTANHVVSSGRK